MYCSLECRDEAYHNYHEYECKLSHFIQSVETPWQMAIEAFCRAATLTFKSSHEDIFTEHRKTVFDYDFRQDVEQTQRIEDNVFVFMGNRQLELMDWEIESAKVVAMQLLALNDVPEELLSLVHDFICEAYRASLRHSQALEGLDCDPSCPVMKNISCVFLPFCSLLNHSCIPNIRLFPVGRKVVMIAIEPIRKGDQIFMCYG